MKSYQEYTPCPGCNDEWIEPSVDQCKSCFRRDSRNALIEENTRLRLALEEAMFALKVLEGPILHLSEIHRRMAVGSMSEIRVALKK